MKSMFSVLIMFMTLIIGSSVYIYFRLRPLLPAPGTWLSVVAKCVYVIVFFSYLVGMMLQRDGHYALSTPFLHVGAWMLAAILYFVLTFVLIDILRGINAFTLKAEILTFRYRYGDSGGHFWSLVGCIITALVLICGYFNAKFPTTTHLTYKTDKEISRDFKYVLISDVHLGMINCDHFMEVLKDRINAENPDFVVIAGDFFDGDPYPVINSNVGNILREIKTGYGIFAVNGNHEWIGNANVADEFLKKHGVTVLRDSTARLPFGVTIVGREDFSAGRPGGKRSGRKPLAEVVANIDRNDYTILLDHQPKNLDEAANSGAIDIELSGHTHAGAQLWPLFVLSRSMYENDYGQLRKLNTDFYTTSGYGTWGPPIRTSARPEMVVIEVSK